MANIKTKICILGTAAAILLCGCENGGNKPPASNTESSTSAITTFVTEITNNTEASKSSEATEITKNTEASETTQKTDTAETTQKDAEDQPNEMFDKSKYFEVHEYADDKIVPAEWIPVYSFAEAAKNFDEVVSSDISKMNAADAVIALANKNVIFVDSFVSYLFWEADMDSPYYSETYKNPYYPDKPIYPMTIEYFTDTEEIYNLGSDIYTEEAFWDWNNPKGIPKKLFIEENGASYVDVLATPNWNFQPFAHRTYIEFISETENKCRFIWHIPDFEKLNAPEEGYEYYYYGCDCEAVYENGSWKLSEVYVEGYSLRIKEG